MKVLGSRLRWTDIQSLHNQLHQFRRQHGLAKCASGAGLRSTLRTRFINGTVVVDERPLHAGLSQARQQPQPCLFGFTGALPVGNDQGETFMIGFDDAKRFVGAAGRHDLDLQLGQRCGFKAITFWTIIDLEHPLLLGQVDQRAGLLLH